MGKSTISMAIFNSYVKLPDVTILQGLVNVPWLGNIGWTSPEKVSSHLVDIYRPYTDHGWVMWKMGTFNDTHYWPPYPLVICYIAIERSTICNGKIHYFDWAIFNSYFDITRGYWNQLFKSSLCRHGFGPARKCLQGFRWDGHMPL